MVNLGRGSITRGSMQCWLGIHGLGHGDTATHGKTTAKCTFLTPNYLVMLLHTYVLRECKYMCRKSFPIVTCSRVVAE